MIRPVSVAPPVKIGLLLPYTGALSVQGNDTTHGFELQWREIGGRAGGREIQLLNAIVDKIPAVSQESTWGWWNKK